MRHLFIFVLVCSCGGVVVIEGGDDDDASAAPDHAPDANAPDVPAGGDAIGEEDWSPHDGPHCVDDCAAWVSGCWMDRVCVEPNALCPGRDAERAHDLIACVCAGCAETCGGSCVMFDTTDAACLACQQTMVTQTCSYEHYACLDP